MRSYLAGASGVAALLEVLVLAAAIAAAVVVARRLPPLPTDPAARAAQRKGRVLAVIAGIMAFGWVVQVTVLAYWRSQMPN